VVVTILAGVFLVLGTNSPYFSRLWRYWTDDRPTNKSYWEYLGINQRVVYWVTAFRIFEDHPWMGVGLGNYAFYFDDELPDQPWYRSPEIIRQITPLEGQDRLITPKNFYARLLAETGLVGTATFTTFLIAVFGDAIYLWFSRRMEEKFWGIAGVLGLMIFGVVLFSFDSFALPNMWVVFGLTTSAAGVAYQERSRRAAPLREANQTIDRAAGAEILG
jgi:O-antigen ligase